MALKQDALIVAGVAVALFGIAWYAKSKVVDAAGAVGDAVSGAVTWVTDEAGNVVQAVNPVNDKNIFYSGTNSVVQAVTGQPNQTLGGWIYDIFH